jgi:5-methylcytosine-specific restriction endonuclease McrA
VPEHRTFPKPEPRKKAQRSSEYRDELEAMRPLVTSRAHGICEVCSFRQSDQIHHKLRRSQGGTNHLANLVAVCSDCHSHIHDNPAWSYQNGWLIRSK